MNILPTIVAKSELLILLIPIVFFSILAYPLLNKDYVIFSTKTNKYQLNLFNWTKPTWNADLASYYQHYGPLLIVSRELVTYRCRRGCCQWVGLRSSTNKHICK